jgi:hypothetical protein
VGADEPSVDEFEFARRRLTAAAYGFSSWSEFREWRKRNPRAYRERSRSLLDPVDPGGEPSAVVDLFTRVEHAGDLRTESSEK